MGRKAIYAGSFDPVTEGHLDIIHRGARLYDELVIAVGNNPSKRYLFDLETRERFVRHSITGVDNVSVVSFDGLLVQTAEEVGADVILRGLRALSDFDLEFRNGLANRDLSGIETVFLISAPERVRRLGGGSSGPVAPRAAAVRSCKTACSWPAGLSSASSASISSRSAAMCSGLNASSITV